MNFHADNYYFSIKTIYIILIQNIILKHNTNIYLEQDGAPTHRCKANKHLLNKLFPNGHWIQNLPNSPDLAYPI